MKVGDYVRTDDGLIGKVVSEPYEYKDSIGCDIDFGNNDIYNEYEMYQIIIKSSPNIIDLIEVGDYVNGYKVISIGIDDNHKNVELYVANQGYDELVLEQDIKSIVTKEQFESIKYNLENN